MSTIHPKPLSSEDPLSRVFKTLTLKSETKRSSNSSTLWTLWFQFHKDPLISHSWCRLKVLTTLLVEELLLQVPSNKVKSKSEIKSNSTATDVKWNPKLSVLKPSTKLWITEKLVIMLVFWSEVWPENKCTEVWLWPNPDQWPHQASLKPIFTSWTNKKVEERILSVQVTDLR